MAAPSRVVRAQDHLDTLTLYPGYRPIALAALLGVGMLVLAGVLLAQAHPRVGVVAGGLAIALVLLGFAVYLARAPRPLLIVSRRGLAAPLHQPSTGEITWPRIAQVHPLFIWANGIAVELWRDPDDHDAGTRLGLFIPGGMFPLSSTRVLREIDHRAPTD